ncbi:zonadhesin [Bombyx mori]|uniref:zonadhesin n=1 Tax=Bombyx mori TaxID=7091 RepID=UPI000B3C9E5E
MTCSEKDLLMPYPFVRQEYCKAGCVCKEGYLKDDSGKCVARENCPNSDLCSENEIHVNCVLAQCGPMTCSEKDLPMPCPLVRREYCKAGCVCKEGYLKDDSGKCVARENCPNLPSCTRPHEKHAFVMDCPPERSCKNRGIKFSCLADQKREQKCVCDEGYVRNESNECIEEENCDKCSEPNEEYTDCKRTCPPELCISIVAKFNCKSDEPCEAGCACKPGYYRQQNNTSCIPACQCQEMAGTPECRATIDQ